MDRPTEQRQQKLDAVFQPLYFRPPVLLNKVHGVQL